MKRHTDAFKAVEARRRQLVRAKPEMQIKYCHAINALSELFYAVPWNVDGLNDERDRINKMQSTLMKLAKYLDLKVAGEV